MERNGTHKITWAIVGTFIHSTESDPVVILNDHCAGIKDGKIMFLQKNDDKLPSVLEEFSVKKENIVYLRKSEFVIPGLIDTHIHASQYPNCGKGLDKGLLQWLEKYTFPVEAKLSEPEFAATIYQKVVSKVVSHGTTTACYFATIDTDATLQLCSIIGEIGQRALVGKVNMNQNSPDFYCETSKQSIEDTLRFVKEVQKTQNARVKPCITPRFAITCCMDLMKQLADIANKYDLHIQTHVCETKEECAKVRELYPKYRDYIDVYENAGLLTQKTILAHGVYLTPEEIKVVRDRQSAISHCPNSNLSIRSGLLDVRKLLDESISVGLGTDISGGYSPSMLNAMRYAITTSNVLAIQNGKEYRPLNYRDVFRMATLEGSKVLHMEKNIGNFMVGKEFDALRIDLEAPESTIDVFDDESLEERLQKFIYLGDERNIVSVFVSGEDILQNLPCKMM